MESFPCCVTWERPTQLLVGKGLFTEPKGAGLGKGLNVVVFRVFCLTQTKERTLGAQT